jgi:1,4-dihydroxy-2-naphthoate octaprenyltransferase
MNNPFVLFIRMTRPVFLVGGVFQYALGAGIARYLGHTLDWTAYFVGQAWVTFMQVSVHYLNEYFDAPADAHNANRTPFSGGSGLLGEGRGKLPRRVALLSAVTMLTAVAVVTFIMIRLGLVRAPLVVIMVLGFLGSFFYSVPPVRLSHSGYGELTAAVLFANLVPAFGFLLQAEDLPRLLSMATFPLTFLGIAMILALEFPDYAADQKTLKTTLLVRIGWENGMLVHNLFVLTCYALFGLAMLSGFPAAIALPAFLTFPLALLQIWYLRRIAAGAKPNWTALTLNAVAIFSFSSYLLNFAIWTR